MTAKTHVWLGFALLVLTACTEPFSPELKESDQMLVVDGIVTDDPGPYIVKLSYSGIANEAVPNADVFIVEQDGDRYPLAEHSPGEYRSDPLALRGQVGKSYRLEFTLESGGEYETPFQELLDNPGVDTITAEAQLRYFDDIQREVNGYEFQITSNSSENRDHFYFWQMSATYKYAAEYITYFIFSDSLIPVAEPDQYNYFYCWRRDPNNPMAAGSTRGLQQKKIIRKPLLFVPGDDNKLSLRYSLLVRQYSISEQSYEFWEGVIGQGAISTSLFNTQPYLIKGNVTNVEDSAEIVLGNFTVAGVREKRVYVNRPTEFSLPPTNCILDLEGYESLFLPPVPTGEVLVTVTEDSSRAIAGGGCIDCRQLGGVITPPDWWEE